VANDPATTQLQASSSRLHVLVAGISKGPLCGVHDHATILAADLGRAGCDVTMAWLGNNIDTEAQPAHLGRKIQQRCREQRPDVLLLHYSVFAFSRHGVPSGVLGLARRLRRLSLPVVLFAHELAYPWGLRGWRGAVLALTQRAALIPLVRASASVIVTTAGRLEMLESRPWLPHRPIEVLPVFSNIPRSASASVTTRTGRVGVFSFGAEGLAALLVTRAVADVAAKRRGVHLALIGAPGPDGPIAMQWREAAARVGCPLTFTGTADAMEISRQLAACEIIVFPDPSGPSQRKTSLAAALAHGKPVVALDGPHASPDYADARALVVVSPSPAALSAEIERLLQNRAARLELGARGLAFYEEFLAHERTSEAVLRTIGQMARNSSAATKMAGRRRMRRRDMACRPSQPGSRTGQSFSSWWSGKS